MNNRDGFIRQYISLCIGGILYGAFLVSIPGSIRAFIGQGRGKWWIHFIAALLFVLVTLHISLLNARLGLIVLHCHIDHDESCDPIPWFNRAQVSLNRHFLWPALLISSSRLSSSHSLHY
jgi:hypothetical protein